MFAPNIGKIGQKSPIPSLLLPQWQQHACFECLPTPVGYRNSYSPEKIFSIQVLRPSKFEGHCPMIRHGCRMALMAA
ncbi:MAG: hypothetical protein BECKG1743D_GA0114223_112621, partial [Candidatus Kentron sp. G]